MKNGLDNCLTNEILSGCDNSAKFKFGILKIENQADRKASEFEVIDHLRLKSLESSSQQRAVGLLEAVS